MRTTITRILLAGTLYLALLAPSISMAQSKRESDRRQQTKNEWRNIGIGSGVVALLGLLKNDGTLTFLGTAGALYSAHRYEQDRKSQSKIDRARASMFSRRSFTRNGVRYERRTVYKGGKKHYQFVKVTRKR